MLSSAVFGVVLVTLALTAFTLYRRRGAIIALLNDLPDAVTVTVGEMTYTQQTDALVEPTIAALRGVAVDVARSAPVLALKLLLFAILLYGLLLRPGRAGRAVLNVVPREYHGIVRRFHGRTRDTLYGIYVLQAATAAGTFLIAAVTFYALGYDAPVTLAVAAGVLQFIPVVGPGVLLGVLAVVDIVGGNVVRAVLVAVVGGAVVGLLPDAVIRPRLASYAAHLPVSLYFVGFTGGVLSLGAIGFIAGPLAVALVAEAVALLSGNGDGTEQATL
ncbi:AI-2E family transporter [Halosegnis marinus]|uniref:AI-2E family transporter n=1 Tax=Halosegnis marinus TaxID=3034023 RepID=UPI0036225F51